MAVETPPFPLGHDGFTTTSEQTRRAFRTRHVEGIEASTDLLVSQKATPNMSVDVAAGEAWVLGDDTTAQGVYYFYNPSTLNVAVTAAHATNPRKDIVVARVRDGQYVGSPTAGADNKADIEVIAGTPAGSPAEPALPNNALKLATIDIAALATTVVAGNITDRRVRSTNYESATIVDSETAIAVAASKANIVNSVTIALPVGWREMDIEVHGKVVFVRQTPSTEIKRATTYTESPAGTNRDSGFISVTSAGTGSAYVTDPICLRVAGLTADTTFAYAGEMTAGTGGLGVFETASRYIYVAKFRRR